MRKIIKFFDRLEDHIRTVLSKYPLVYAFIGGVGVVLFWRGVEHTADNFTFMTGPVSLLISIIILLLTGLFVSFFVGENIILTGLKHEKKLVEKTESEIRTEEVEVRDIEGILVELQRDVADIKRSLSRKK